MMFAISDFEHLRGMKLFNYYFTSDVKGREELLITSQFKNIREIYIVWLDWHVKYIAEALLI